MTDHESLVELFASSVRPYLRTWVAASGEKTKEGCPAIGAVHEELLRERGREKAGMHATGRRIREYMDGERQLSHDLVARIREIDLEQRARGYDGPALG